MRDRIPFVRNGLGAMHRSVLVIALLSLVALLSTWVIAAPAATAQESQKWALLVGVDRYDSDQISPLKCAAADARALSKTLIEVCGFPESHVIVMTCDSPSSDRPTAENVLSRLAGFESSCKTGDEFVFFFSGHGMEQDGKSYLLTSNARLGSYAALKKSCLALEEVQAAIREVKASRVMQLVDACRNDPRSGKAAVDNKLTRGMSRDLALVTTARPSAEAAVTIFSCSVGQRSYENYNGHGYFTYFLLEGLRGNARTADGSVTLPSLVTYLERMVPEAVRLRESGMEQVPWAVTSGTSYMHWVLSRPGTASTRTSTTPGAGAHPVTATRPATASVGSSTSGGREMVNGVDGSVLVRVGEGAFTMGSSDGRDNEKPPHLVKLKPYWIGKYAVTNEQFSRFAASTGYVTEAERDEGSWIYTGKDWVKTPGGVLESPGRARIGGGGEPSCRARDVERCHRLLSLGRPSAPL